MHVELIFCPFAGFYALQILNGKLDVFVLVFHCRSANGYRSV